MTSNNIFPNFPMSDCHMDTLEPVPRVQLGMVSDVANYQRAAHFSGLTQKTGFVEPVFGNPLLNPVGIPNNGISRAEFSGMLNRPGNQGAVMFNNMLDGNLLLPVKRKAEIGTISNSYISQHSLLPNKRPSHMSADAKSLGTVMTVGKSGPPPGLPAQSSITKKMARSESKLGKSGLPRGQPTKKQTTHIRSPQDASEAVRSKMRESLSSALELAMPKPDNVSSIEKNSSDSTTAQKFPMASQTSESDLNTSREVPDSGPGEYVSQDMVAAGTINEPQMLSSATPTEIRENGECNFQEFHNLPEVDVSFIDNFFIKDDLLQGNGLSWDFNFDMNTEEIKDAQNSENLQAPQSVKNKAGEHRNKGVVATLTPEDLAFRIEAELFKLHCGVNKKYREKGRSLLFNLKDRNNPELRERVISGEIPPERLCSMSAEELASKELSEWRIAKAEEMAQMVVLPDTGVDMRRLVKKTHKGEYQVEFERDESVLAEVSSGTSVFPRSIQHKEAKTKTKSPSNGSHGDKDSVVMLERNSENKDIEDSLIIPTDGTDLLQAMMVDELKDAQLLPPIVSLDEFMKSLDSEPPFEKFSEDGGRKMVVPNENRPIVKPQGSGRASDSSKDASYKSGGFVGKHDIKKHAAELATIATKSLVNPGTSPKVDYIWEGKLQLTMSSSVTVGGLFHSGEKTSTTNWPVAVEIKGRVRLDAFEKFLQELHKSRSRTVMVLQFRLKNKSSEQESSNLSEAIASYSSDDRLGYAEPSSGAELYLCPPTPKILEILNKCITKEVKTLAESGLIGVVVWRRGRVSGNTISPNCSSSSHHNQALKRQQNQPHDPPFAKNARINTPTSRPKTISELEEDDDVPPGFGPKDDDDLPEFNFSGSSVNPSLLPRGPSQMNQSSVDHVRDLIQKYGKSGGTKPWNHNDDDDDDIPEWQPQQVHQQSLHGQVVPTSNHYVVTQQTPRPGGGRWC